MKEGHKQKVDTAEVVSFDVFDTLLARKTVNPRDVFTIARELFNEQSPYTMTDDFYFLRFESEKSVRLKKPMQTDVTIDEIYEEFGTTQGYDKDFCNTLKHYELEAELMMLTRDMSTYELYEYAKEQNKQIIIVSDMYLLKDQIVRLLRKNGIDTWSDLIVSSEDQLAKFTGSAYAELARRYPGKRVVHIGDNIHSDIDWAKRFGFATIHIHSNMEKLSFEIERTDRAIYGGNRYRWTKDKETVSVDDVQFNILSGLAAQYCVQPNITATKAVGYSFFGPVLLSYIQWLHRQAQAYETDHIFFLARDGAIMLDAYNAYYKKQALPSTYMLGSRRVLNFPSLHKDNFSLNNTDQIMGGGGKIDIARAFENYHINPNDKRVDTAMEQVGLRGVRMVAPGEEAHRFQAVLLILEPLILEQSKKEADTILGYLEQVGLTTAKRPLVADVGWNGSMQVALQLLLGKKIQGAYFGLYNSKKAKQISDAATGYFDPRTNDPSELKYEEMFAGYGGVLIIESLFTNPDQGTIIGIKKDKNGQYKGIEGEHDNDDSERASVREMHKAAMQFIADFSAIGLPQSLEIIRKEVAMRPVKWTVCEPNDVVAEIFGKVKYSHVISSVPEYVGHPLHDAAYYKKHKTELVDEYKRAHWKVGFRKNCERLGIPLN